MTAGARAGRVSQGVKSLGGRRALVVQHVGIEGPGRLEGWLAEGGWVLEVRDVERGDGLPESLGGYDALVVLGGFMSVHDREQYPHLARTEDLLRQAVARDVPVLGLCLGGQLLASALGGRVTRNPVREIGPDRVTLTAAGRADPLFAGCPAELPVFQWHGETFAELPPGAVWLASSPACRHQAFRVGRRAYGLQFHFEVTEEMVADWARRYEGELRQARGLAPEGLVAEFRRQAAAIAAAGGRLARNLLALWAEPPAAPP